MLDACALSVCVSFPLLHLRRIFSVSLSASLCRSKMNKSSYKHVPHREKPPHLVAKRNERERRRVQQVNSAFSVLRKTVPVENRNKRLSKVKTLQRAIEYIESLTGLLSSLGAEMPPLSSLHGHHRHHDDDDGDDDDDDLVESPDASSSQSQSPFMLIGDADRSISPIGSPTVITSHSNETTRYLDSPDGQVYGQLPYQSGDSCNPAHSVDSSTSTLNNNLCGKSKSKKTHFLTHNANLMHEEDRRLHLFKSEQLFDEETHSTHYSTSINQLPSHSSFDVRPFNQMNQSLCFTLAAGDINSNMNTSCITSHHEIVRQHGQQQPPPPPPPLPPHHHPHHLHDHEHGASGLHHHRHSNASACGNPSSHPNANNRSNDFACIYSQLQ